MEPENDGFQKESHFPGTSFQVPCQGCTFHEFHKIGGFRLPRIVFDHQFPQKKVVVPLYGFEVGFDLIPGSWFHIFGGCQCNQRLHPGRLTWNLKIAQLKSGKSSEPNHHFQGCS